MNGPFQTSTSNVSASHPSQEGLSPAVDPRETLPRIVRSALLDPSSELQRHLSATELHFMRSFYIPTVPDLSDGRRSQYQHRANATSTLFEHLKDRGVSRADLRCGLEQVRYLPFVDECKAWMRSGSQPTAASTPHPIAFDVRNRAYAKDAFQWLAQELRIPHYLFEHGKIEPIALPKAGFGMRIHSNGDRWTFLMALANGTMLEAPSEDSQEIARGLSSPNRQLLNILELQAPAHLEKALAPRPVIDAGSKRVSLFVRNDDASPTSYIYLPPSITESHLVPRIDWHALGNGTKRIVLLSADSKKQIATVTIPSGDNPTPALSLGREVVASPFTRFKPLARFLRADTSVIPQSVEIEVHRSTKTPAHTQQRILLGKQMSVPAWYPLRTITVHPSVAPNGTRFLALYPPGVSPKTNPPLRAFILEEARTHLKPIEVAAVWPGLKKRAEEINSLVRDVVRSNSETSRDAWLAINEIRKTEPLVTSTLLISNESPFSLYDEESLGRLKELAGWIAFRSGLETALLEDQARSTPYVAHLLAHAHGVRNVTTIASLAQLKDVSFSVPRDPLSRLIRLATVAPTTFEDSIRRLRDSHTQTIRELAGTGSVRQLLYELERLKRSRPTQ